MTKVKKHREKHAENPFLKDMQEALTENIRTKRTWLKGDNGVQTSLVSTGTGEIVGEGALFSWKKVDTERFIKVYSCKMGDMFSMPRSANKVFQYILCNLIKDQDRIYLYDGELCGVLKLSSKSIYRSLQFLIDNEFIAKCTSPYWYFINPNLFFNGDRLVLMEVYEKEHKQDNEPLNQSGFTQYQLPSK